VARIALREQRIEEDLPEREKTCVRSRDAGVKRTRATAHPFYWASFSLHGSWW